ncbi:MAG: M28 family peptidase [Bacteroidota bacterium]|nr:M28 family peptidase [Bacteroidota bacterium]
MIRNKTSFSSLIAVFLFIPLISFPQKSSSGPGIINSGDLQAYVSFLAAPEMKGRANGEPELEIAVNYLVSQAKLIGLRPANGSSYLQPYAVMQKMVDQDKSSIKVFGPGGDSVLLREPMIQLFPSGGADFELEGEIVFAGYGIKAEKYNYNDLEDVPAAGNILLIMNRSPLSEDGTRSQFEEPVWSSFMSIQAKLTNLLFSKAKAILIVCDPKSGYSSIDQQYPGIAHELSSNKYLKGTKPTTFDMPAMPRVMYVERAVADELLNGTGHTLDELQNMIDRDLKPQSFTIPGKRIKINEASKTQEVILHNVAATINGSDPQLKKEFVVFSAHADHIGGAGDKINDGADDDASGCATILELAKAFQSLDRKPMRSLLFLWVTGEEIGLFGSQSYVNNPVVPIEKTVADLNMDMIGRVKSVADTSKDNPMTGKTGVFVITDNQSKELISIADEADKKSPIDIDYSLSGRENPLQLFSRSDHYNFVKKDIPILFFTTGLHTDYHTPRDVVEKIDFDKMELIARMVYDIGFTVANKKTRLVVDNPYSKW